MPFLPPAIPSKLHVYQLGILQEFSSPTIVIGGRVNHKDTEGERIASVKARSKEKTFLVLDNQVSTDMRGRGHRDPYKV